MSAAVPKQDPSAISSEIVIFRKDGNGRVVTIAAVPSTRKGLPRQSGVRTGFQQRPKIEDHYGARCAIA